MALPIEAVRALAAVCMPMLNDPQIDATLRDVVIGLALHESRLEPTAVHINPNGTIDRGMLQINSPNLARLGLTPETAFDPCQSLHAGAEVFMEALSRYNTGTTTRGFTNGYVVAALKAIHAARGSLGAVARPSLPPGSAAAFPPSVDLESSPGAGEIIFTTRESRP